MLNHVFATFRDQLTYPWFTSGYYSRVDTVKLTLMSVKRISAVSIPPALI